MIHVLKDDGGGEIFLNIINCPSLDCELHSESAPGPETFRDYLSLFELILVFSRILIFSVFSCFDKSLNTV